MGKDETKDLQKFLKPFSEETRELVFWLREWVWDLYPGANELIYDSYNAVAFGWSVTDRLGHTFCSIAVPRSGSSVHFGFYWGSEITDPKHILLGEGNQYRYIRVSGKKDFPKTYIKTLLRAAYTNSLMKVKDPKQIVKGMTITKAIAAKKRQHSKIKQSDKTE